MIPCSVFTFESGDLGQGLGVGGRVEEGSWDAGGEERPTGSHGPVDAGENRHTVSNYLVKR